MRERERERERECLLMSGCVNPRQNLSFLQLYNKFQIQKRISKDFIEKLPPSSNRLNIHFEAAVENAKQLSFSDLSSC